MGFYFLLKSEKKALFWTGFFIGIFWFYWISLSFRFYDGLSFLIPFVFVGIGLFYGLIFYIVAKLSKTVELRAVFIFLLSFFTPFGFNWLKLELVFINSYFSTNIYLYGVFLALLTLFMRLKKRLKIIPIAALIGLLFANSQTTPNFPKLNIALSATNLPQDKKWNPMYKDEIIRGNFWLIDEAIKQKKDLIVLSESAFPLYLNIEDKLLERLKSLSFQIPIVTGALRVQNNRVYNSTFYFNHGKVQIADKVVLVPFGEQIPFPSFMRDFINEVFFNGASDYLSASTPTDFEIKGYKFRNAICYEATTDEIYKDSPTYIVALSNNAWFTPSIEPTLQKLLLKLYAKKYNTITYHSANSGISGVILP